ncbi:hypothetical protein [Mesorhizobium neociceri]|uniref:Uncharacterized protein n=1 Tax=Mesorhizobium neociceri TaxID=1307853 RepID=A0A838B878_9HYPH|nr:hypothetical protein [Mesorhizobium neociceri]MBA1142342.1 hypothetical protein [Mesorhizobium neociceri]
MKARDPHALPTEKTPEGEQTLISGVRPVTARDRLCLSHGRALAATQGAKAARYRSFRW